MPNGEAPELDETQEEILTAFALYRDEVRGGDLVSKTARLLPSDPDHRYLLATLPTPAPTGLPKDAAGSAAGDTQSAEKPGDIPPAFPDAQRTSTPPDSQKAQGTARTRFPDWRQFLPGWGRPAGG